MKYNLENIKLRKVAEGKQNAGSLFIQASVVNPDDEWDEPGTLTTFNERLVAKFAQYLLPSQPGAVDQFGRQTWQPSQLKDATNPIPAEMLVMTHAQFEEYPFPGGVEYVALNDGSNTPRVNPKNGQFYRRKSITVLTKKVVDNETGEVRYAKGWTPAEQASGIINNMYAPASQFEGSATMGIQLPISAETPLINSASAPQQPQQVVQQPAPQATAQPAF